MYVSQTLSMFMFMSMFSFFVHFIFALVVFAFPRWAQPTSAFYRAPLCFYRGHSQCESSSLIIVYFQDIFNLLYLLSSMPVSPFEYLERLCLFSVAKTACFVHSSHAFAMAISPMLLISPWLLAFTLHTLRNCDTLVCSSVGRVISFSIILITAHVVFMVLALNIYSILSKFCRCELRNLTPAFGLVLSSKIC